MTFLEVLEEAKRTGCIMVRPGDHAGIKRDSFLTPKNQIGAWEALALSYDLKLRHCYWDDRDRGSGSKWRDHGGGVFLSADVFLSTEWQTTPMHEEFFDALSNLWNPGDRMKSRWERGLGVTVSESKYTP